LLSDRPLIAVTGRRLPTAKTGMLAEAWGLSRTYLDALDRAGGQPVVLPAAETNATDAIGRLRGVDGLVLAGGADIDPARYGESPREEVYGVDPLVDEFEINVIRAAIALEKPVLAICRGLQVLNVATGGTLDQHITGAPGLLDHGTPSERRGAVHTVDVDAGSRLAKALGADTSEGMSVHHQVIRDLGDGLTVTARTSDGVIEGVECDTGWVVGVQWHPEMTAAFDSVQQALFDSFVAQTRDA
jgi:putative glutamine amidotransferase